ncbi:D-inositol 3-phosphate glycosyltransferase [Acidimicrobiaceae bacterium]|nr:D-inositol 3-phosphate glycosyltransferase [Acidimicrobiaceae bacterium]
MRLGRGKTRPNDRFYSSMNRVAIISMHTSPLAQPGVGDGGGMNVYVRELVSAMAQTGLQCTTYTRAWREGLPEVIDVEPNHKVVHIKAGKFDLSKDELLDVVDEFTQAVARDIELNGGTDVLHANYWLSGLVGHRLKHQLGLPLVNNFPYFGQSQISRWRHRIGGA